MDKLPIYELQIDLADESGVKAVALVESPAIGIGWQAFKEQTEQIKFKVTNEEQRIVFGALMIPEMLIYRRDDDGFEYNVKFTAKTISDIREKFMKNRLTDQTNPMHVSELTLQGVYMVETFITDETRGIHPPEAFKELPYGTWFGGFRVENDEIWNDFIKTGVFTGFSVEGLFKKVKLSKQDMATFKEQIADLFKTYFGEPKKTEELKFVSISLMDGTSVKIEPAIEVGASMQVVSSEGDIPAPDGVHEVSDGTMITTEGGLITELKEKLVEGDENKEFIAQFKSALDAFAATKGEIEAIKAENVALKEQIEGQTKVNEEIQKGIVALSDAIAKIPAAAPTDVPPTPTKMKSQAERAIEMAETLAKLREKK